LPTVDDGDTPVEFTDLRYLTVTLREIAGNVLQNNYGIMSEQSIIDKLGKDNASKACREAEGCLAQLGRKINADYIGQARLGRFDGNLLTISVELYNSASGIQVGTIRGDAKNVSGLLNVLNEKAPGMFRKMPGVSSGKPQSPTFDGGIGGVQTGGGYQLEVGKTYLVNISTEPKGAVLSFDGIPDSRCAKTPCKIVLSEGAVRIVAALEQYERADTTVSIRQNNQNIDIKLKSNFGVLEIKPAYSENIGSGSSWSLAINGKAYSSFENKLPPGSYEVKLSHECYEDISFKAGINQDKREVFDMASYVKLKKGGLVLNVEKNGEPAVEPVYVNGNYVGDTPFSDAVPLCSDIKVGENREKVDVVLKYNDNVVHTHKMGLYEPIHYAPIASGIENAPRISTWVAVGLDVLGAAIIGFAVYENTEANKAYDNYNIRGYSSDYYENTWKDVETFRKNRNISYVIGGLVLASGIGVHIWF